MILLITLYIIDILGRTVVIFPNERDTCQNRTRWSCIARYLNVDYFYGNRKYFFNGLIPMSRHGPLLWSYVLLKQLTHTSIKA